jgi:penicillin-binding protein 1C
MIRRGLIVLALALLPALLVLDRLFPPDLSRYRMQSVELLDRKGEPLNVATTPDGMWRLATAPEDVGQRYLSLLLAAEDHRFYSHPGIDPLALLRAVWQFATRGHVISGGSTLTMQAARLLEPHRHDLAGKIFDMLRALQLEAHHSKQEILSIYLTLAPFGGNIEGVRAASLAYFGHGPRSLTDQEAALLVALPQSPTRLRPDRYPERARAAQLRVLQRVGKLPEDERGTIEPVIRQALPAHAAHLARRLAGGGEAGRIATILDGSLQAAIEEMARREQNWLGSQADLAALVVRNADRAVLAYLGGIDYLGPGGMVDMVRARRSPGSTLKPFIYGIALDEALILPDTLIDDAPLRIGDYAPQNFDREFHGTVTVREALQQSYNLPAVAILNELGPARVATALQQAGAKLLLPHGSTEFGLPLALGGVGISLEDLAVLYAALADGGQGAPLHFRAGEKAGPKVPLMTEAAAAEIGAVLRGTPLPDGIAPVREREVAYKTGTSYGFRDAWAVGYSAEYTVAVWVGRVEGSPRPGSFGRNTAAPILFHIFDMLPPEAAALPLPSEAAGLPEHLAPGLHHYGPRRLDVSPRSTAPLQILFPPAGASLDVDGAGASAPPVSLEASGGERPYRWSVNGVPLPDTPVGSTASWKPDGPGFVRLSVTDRDDETVSEEVRVE